MMYCAYCGQSFKRKEHLERHLPSHTNVKPYKCDLCQLSFTRRDLLQKHNSTYHDPHRADLSTASRNPIACTNCATAKAGCDKKVPCSRCTDKNLPCAARFARRASRGIYRSSPASSITQASQRSSDSARTSLERDCVPDMKRDNSREGSLKSSQSQPELLMWEASQNLCIDASRGIQFSPNVFQTIGKDSEGYPGTDGSLRGRGDFGTDNVDMATMNLWNSCSMELDMCESNDIDFSHQPTMNGLWYPQPSDGFLQSLPSPPSTISASHSRIPSISPVWGDLSTIPPQIPSETPPNIKNGEIPELDSMIATEEAWPLARCNPRIFSGNCPRTAIVHLEALQDCSKLEGAWNSMNDMITPNEKDTFCGTLAIKPLLSTTRDKIIAFAQSFLLRALMTHQSGLNSYPHGSGSSKPNFFTLPPSNVLENLMRCSVQNLSPYYSLIHGMAIDPNEMMLHDDPSTLLFLLMMAQGASMVPKAEARYLAAGLTETCRISLFDVIERNVELSADPIVLKSAFLFTQLGAWGGDAWHIKQAMGQRGMYVAVPRFNESSDTELRWREWLRCEHIYRMVYNWSMLDQELSLFHDTTSILSITELRTPLPSSESLWRTNSAKEWLEMTNDINSHTGHPDYQAAIDARNNLSLSQLFQDMLRDELEMKNRQLSPALLKLLLHPLQSLVSHVGQLLSCFYGIHSDQLDTRPLTTASTLMRLEEVQSSLHKWHEYAMVNYEVDPSCPTTTSSLVLYHLIYLNTVTYFPEIERLARVEGFNGRPWDAAHRHKQCIYQTEKAVFHCGQIFRLVSNMPETGRPAWWSAALYRATMILFVDGLSRRHAGEIIETGQVIMINSVIPEDLALKQYLATGYGTPGLLCEGSFVKLGDPENIISYCISLLDGGNSTRFSDGIRRKLQTLLGNWKTR